VAVKNHETPMEWMPLLCKAALVAEATALEMAITVAVQMEWRQLENGTDSSILVQCLEDKDAVPIEISMLVDHCLRFKNFFFVVSLGR